MFKESRYRSCKRKIYNPLDENGSYSIPTEWTKKDAQRHKKNDSQHIKNEAEKLLRANKDLEACIYDLHHELDWYRNQEDMQTNYKEKLLEPQTQWIINHHFNLKT